MSAHDEEVSLLYLQWQDLYSTEKPFQVFANVPEGSDEKLTNLVFGLGPLVKIHDIRGQEDRFHIDQHGFMVIHDNLPPSLDLTNKSTMTQQVIPQLESLLLQHLDGVDFIRCFDWAFRKNVELSSLEGRDLNDPMQLLGAGKQVHCDQSPAGALGRLHEHAPELVPIASRGRLRIVNIWRPLYHPAQDNTLALCDGTTIDESDCIEADHVRRTYLGATNYGMYSPRHRWYYLHHQTPEEVLLFKIFDSSPDVPAKFSLHASFDCSSVPSDAQPRESLEARFLVVTSHPEGDQ